MSDMCIHLTNYAINKLNPNFIFNQSQELDILGHKRSQMLVLKLLQENNHDVTKFGARSRRSYYRLSAVVHLSYHILIRAVSLRSMR